jgi:long-subunit acyl-CoA synthetase (AMP-forming)
MTKEVIDKDGWMKTGDVCMILPENGALKFIDRRCNFFPIENGMYLSSFRI